MAVKRPIAWYDDAQINEELRDGDFVRGALAFEILADQVITSGGQINVGHSLGVAPDIVRIMLINVTAEHGYVAGDQIPVPNGPQRNNNSGVSVKVDATNAEITYGTAMNPINIMNVGGTPGQTENATNTSWHVRVTLLVLN